MSSSPLPPGAPHRASRYGTAQANWSSLRHGLARAVPGAVGLAGVIVLWSVALTLATDSDSLAVQFSPARAFAALPILVAEDHLLMHITTSLRRIASGLAIAVLLGVPLGFVLGRIKAIDATLSPVLQFLRMVSPLSWMPIAVMSLGVGERPVIFLLAFAGLWPVLMSTAHGVAQIDRRWVQLGESLAATPAEMLLHVYLPGIASHVLTGVRLAIGILWIVLVPAEMLGVSSGLGYLVLDTRDRLAYSELTAIILVIGTLGFMLDQTARLAWNRFGTASSMR